MSKALLATCIEQMATKEGLSETGITGVKVFKITTPISCGPAVYEPSITAIVSGSKEAIVDGTRQFFDDTRYLCCNMSMPVEAGTPAASPETPLLGVYVSLNSKIMTELVFEWENASSQVRQKQEGGPGKGILTCQWDDTFTDALWRLMQLAGNTIDRHLLESSRLRELYFAVLKGSAGPAIRRAFGVGNEIARSIEYLSTHLGEPITIDHMASQIGMSRAVFHRKFKQATNLSPIQFVKAMRLNSAAMRIAGGSTVNTAALDVGYASTSQFSREFKRMYGNSPKQWSQKFERNMTL